MKKIIYLLAAISAFSFVYAQQTPQKQKTATPKKTIAKKNQAKTPNKIIQLDTTNSIKYAEISFNETNYGIGSINKGLDLFHEFVFVNSGNAPLKITNIQGAPAEFSADSIQPGMTGSIKVVIKTNDSPVGQFNKQIIVTTNSKNPVQVLNIVGFINE